jgi:hypothetical protein
VAKRISADFQREPGMNQVTLLAVSGPETEAAPTCSGYTMVLS